jgi:hypothetical protein
MSATDQKTACCWAWEHLGADDRDTWPWQALHELAHSPVPFSTTKFAELGRLSEREADQIITQARRRRWLVRIAPSRRDAIWRGCLPRER